MNKPEYIDRNALINDLIHNRSFYPAIVKNAIKNAPTADVVAVVHGEWEWHAKQHGNRLDGMDEDFGYRCSRCKVWADEYGVDGDIYEEPPTNMLHYCPNCGADMRKDAK